MGFLLAPTFFPGRRDSIDPLGADVGQREGAAALYESNTLLTLVFFCHYTRGSCASVR